MKLTLWDTAKQLITEVDVLLYLQACIEEAPDDEEFLANAITTVSRSPAVLNDPELKKRCLETSSLRFRNYADAVQDLVNTVPHTTSNSSS